MEFEFTLSPELAVAAEVWALGVIRLHAELDLQLAEAPHSWGGDDLVGVYYARNRLAERLAVDRISQPPAIVVVADEFLRTFSDDAEVDWAEMLGHQSGDGWWWSLVPSRGPVREELGQYGLGGHY